MVGLLGCTMLIGWHRATVAHGRCVEHGDEIHLDRVGGVTAWVADGVDDGDGQDHLGASDWAARDGDHHCDLLTAPHGVASIDTPRLDAAHLEAPPAPPAPRVVAPASASLFRLAPKTSPPA